MKKMIITGNVGRDPELRADASGNQFVTFSVGVSVGTKQNPKTDWIEVSCGGRLVDVTRNYVKKGSKLLIEGFPSTNAYINRENKPVATLRLNANNLEFLSSKKDDDITQNTDQDNTQDSAHDISTDNSTNNGLNSDDIPF
jgi:single-strand DNA-binding protein